MHTQVGIIGAGPAGLLLSHLLHRAGIESVVLERRSRHYVENRIRAGVLEQGSVDLLLEAGLGQRLLRQGMQHHGVELRFGARSHRIDFDSLTQGKGIVVYGQQEVIKDLIAARQHADGQLLFEAEVVSLDELHSKQPRIHYKHNGREEQLSCEFLIGCDGYHGVSRPAIPESERKEFERRYPFAWLGVLVEAAPSAEELIYANSADGFALHSMRSPSLSRNYLQCPPGDRIEDWSEERIWDALHTRLETVPDWNLREGPIVERGITPMRSYVCETMRHGRLLLAGDAAHIVPPTGAKGMNLAISDIRYLSAALTAWYRDGSEELLDSYPSDCLRRVWRGEHFSWYMTSLLHRFDDDSGFQQRLQQAEFDYLCYSSAQATALAENYVGIAY